MAKKTSKPVGERPAIDPGLIDELLKHGHGPEDVKSVLQQITKAVVERALQSEMTEHLGYGKHEAEGRNSGNSRNGVTKKRLKGDFGEIDLETPRDRNGEFEPRLVKKNQTRFSGFDDKILSMYARGMSTRDIQAHIQEMYGVEISPTLVSDIDRWRDGGRAGLAEPAAGAFLRDRIPGCIVRENAARRTGGKPRRLRGHRRDAGRQEGRPGFVDRRNGRGEVLDECADGTAHPRCERHIRRVCRWAERIPAGDRDHFPFGPGAAVHRARGPRQPELRTLEGTPGCGCGLEVVYRATTADQAADELAAFESKWAKYPAIGKLWRSNWEGIVPFFSFPNELRVVVYTTNAVESLHSSLRKVIKTRGSFPNEDAALKLLYLAIVNAAADWETVQNWKPALNYLRTMCEERIAEALGRP
jgi:hypothetical protein